MKRLLILISLLLLCVSSLSAQVQDYHGRLDPMRGFQVTGLAVEDFRIASGTRALMSDSVIMIRLAEVIKADLDFSPFYKNIDADPLFLSGPLGDYYLSQIAAGQLLNSPGLNAGSDLASAFDLDQWTTRTDGVGDFGIVDMGYHSVPEPCTVLLLGLGGLALRRNRRV